MASASAGDAADFGRDIRRQVLEGLAGSDMSDTDAGATEESSAEVVRRAFENVTADETDASHCQPVFPAVPARLIPYFMEQATIHAPAE